MNKFKKAYELTKEDLPCPKNCRVCEENALVFLPGEIEYLSRKFKIPKNKLAHLHEIEGHKIWIITKSEKHCPFYKFGKCLKREIRPLDCRSYPVVPFLSKGKISVKLDKKLSFG